MTKEQDFMFEIVLTSVGRWSASGRFTPVSYQASNEDLEIWKETILLFLLQTCDVLRGLVTSEDIQSWSHSLMTLRQCDIFVADLKDLDKFVMHHLHFEYSEFIKLWRKELRGCSVMTKQFFGRLNYLIDLVAHCDSRSIASLHQLCSFAERVTVKSYPGVEESTLSKWKDNYTFLSEQHALATLGMQERVAKKFNKYNFWTLFSPHHSDGSVLEKEITTRGYRRRLTRLEKYLYTNGRLTRYFLKKAEIQPLPAPFVTEPPPDSTCQMYVPKGVDSRRIVEPECCERVFIQHGIAEALNTVLDHEYGGHYYRHDSSKNGALALSSSMTGRYDTIDISSASDSVRWDLVQSLFNLADPSWVKAIQIARSRFSILPDGTKFPKLAVGSMGSPMTFPLETLVFCELVEESATRAGFVSSKLKYLVYGDDIIVPHFIVDELLKVLKEFGFQPNMKKTFVGEELFRESCGIDAVLGVDITPVRISRFWEKLAKSNARSIASNVDLANRSFGRLPLVRRYLILSIEKEGLFIPFSEDRTGLVLKGVDCSNQHLREGSYDTDLQYRTVKVHQLLIKKDLIGIFPPELSYWEWLQQTERRHSAPEPTTKAWDSLEDLLELPTSVLSSLRCQSSWTADIYT